MSATILRLSEHPLSQHWITQFCTYTDRAVASDFLNQLKLVSNREFETSIEGALITLQTKLNSTIAVYPIAPPLPEEIVGYDPFNGGIPKDAEVESREIGRRRKYGSEDRVGHILSKLQDRYRKGSGVSLIECTPTLKQIYTQRIRHIVLVDDVCGSGKRITDYWHAIPRRVKSLLSLKKLELWIVLYTFTPAGRKKMHKVMPNFPIHDHLITAIPEAELKGRLTPAMINLCMNYGRIIGRKKDSIGYRDSACPIVFEHGCPNNLPPILWVNQKKDWKALFPNRSIPGEMRQYFDGSYTDRAAHELWSSNQPKLALSLLDSFDHGNPLTSEQWMLLTLLGLRLRGVEEVNLPNRLLISIEECRCILKIGIDMGLYDLSINNITDLGKEVVRRFKERFDKRRKKRLDMFDNDLSNYYPSQCEGKLLCPGKTA